MDENVNEYPKVSIVILNYNSGQLLLDCVESITNTDYEIAHQKLIEADKSVKKTIIMIKKNCTLDQAELMLEKAEGLLGRVLKES